VFIADSGTRLEAPAHLFGGGPPPAGSQFLVERIVRSAGTQQFRRTQRQQRSQHERGLLHGSEPGD